MEPALVFIHSCRIDQPRMNVIPTVIADRQNSGLRSRRPPGILPIIHSGDAAPIEHASRLWRCDDERDRERAAELALRAMLPQDRVEALDVAQIVIVEIEIVP